jgi:prepilin-type N-terminal cleavage/methylation domain-containing protein
MTSPTITLRSRPNAKAFTLIELLVVATVLACLATLERLPEVISE